MTAKRKSFNYALLIGAAAGGVAFGVYASRPRSDFDSKGFAIIGAGIGALIGWAVRAVGNDALVYQATPAR